MDVRKALRTVISNGGMPKATLSVSMGKAYTFINTTISRGSIPKTDTFAQIADACGYDLLLRQRSTNDEIIIDPPKPKS